MATIITAPWTLEKIRALTYNDLRRVAKENGVRAVGKKLDLIEELTARLLAPQVATSPETQAEASGNNNGGGIPELRDDELMDVDEINSDHSLSATFLIDKENMLSSTAIAEDPTAPADEMFLSDDEPTLACGGDLTRNVTPVNDAATINAAAANIMTRTISVAAVNAAVELKVKTTKTAAKNVMPPIDVGRSSLSRIPRPGVNSTTTTARYAKSHRIAFDKMPSIVETAMHVATRHKNAMDAVPSSIQRLATPKNVREPIRQRFPTPSTPKADNFHFGDVPTEAIACVQRPWGGNINRTPRPVRKCTRKPEVGVKLLKKTKVDKRPFVAATVPDNDENLDRLATPKNTAAVPISKERRSYTPKRTPYVYVDTMKMTDTDLRMHHRRQRQHDFAEVKRGH